MKSQYIQFLKRLLVFSLIIGAVSYGLNFLLPEEYVSPAMLYILLFFVSVSLLSHYMALKSMAKKMSHFANFFMISIFIKLVLYAVIIVIYVQMYKSDLIPFAITFFIYYVCFTIFELASLLKLQKEK